MCVANRGTLRAMAKNLFQRSSMCVSAEVITGYNDPKGEWGRKPGSKEEAIGPRVAEMLRPADGQVHSVATGLATEGGHGPGWGQEP